MELKQEHIEAWRKTLDTIASDTRAMKRFQLSPDGRFVVLHQERAVYDGSDMTVAVMKYNSL